MADVERAEGNALYKATSGGIRFQMRTAGHGPEIILLASHDSSLQVYKITLLGLETRVKVAGEDTEVKFRTMQLINFLEFKEFCLTWHSNKIKMFLVGENKPLFQYDRLHSEPRIGFVQFQPTCRRWSPVEWIIETSPVVLEPVACRKFPEALRWLPMNNGQLPPDAMIGGFENELTYIARSHHNHSLCPGKYVPSKGLAYVPWGRREHAKTQFEILCGFNGIWVKAKSNEIPPNAFIGGHSEVYSEPLYIGRAMVEGKLISGKVHVRYNLCYLPYNGSEVEVSSFEILVLSEFALPHAILADFNETLRLFNI